jgi:hypothetical protein
VLDPKQCVVSDLSRSAAVNANNVLKRVRLQMLQIVSSIKCLRTTNEGSHAYACKHASGCAWHKGLPWVRDAA